MPDELITWIMIGLFLLGMAIAAFIHRK